MNDRRKNEKSKFTSYCLGIVAILLVGCACFVFLYFQTDIIMDVDTSVAHKVVDFERTTVTTYLQAKDDEGSGGTPGLRGGGNAPGIVPNPLPGGSTFTPTLTGIYTKTTLPEASNEGTFHNLPALDGWPTEWGSPDVTMVDWYGLFDQWKSDIATLTSYSLNDIRVVSTPEVHIDNYNDAGFVNVDGVNCLSTSFFPVWVKFDYYSSSFQGNIPSWLKSDAASVYACFVFKERKTNEVYYIPIVNGDAKGHTAIGGTCQTWVKGTGFDNGNFVGQFANKITVDGKTVNKNETQGGFQHTNTINGIGVGDGDEYTCSIKDMVSLFVSGSNNELHYNGSLCTPKLAYEVNSVQQANLSSVVNDCDLIGIAVKSK